MFSIQIFFLKKVFQSFKKPTHTKKSKQQFYVCKTEKNKKNQQTMTYLLVGFPAHYITSVQTWAIAFQNTALLLLSTSFFKQFLPPPDSPLFTLPPTSFHFLPIFTTTSCTGAHCSVSGLKPTNHTPSFPSTNEIYSQSFFSFHSQRKLSSSPN